MLLCRICEEMVPQHSLEEHSRFCVASSQADNKAQTCNNGLQKIINTLGTRLEENTGANRATSEWSKDDVSLAQNLKGVITQYVSVSMCVLVVVFSCVVFIDKW